MQFGQLDHEHLNSETKQSVAQTTNSSILDLLFDNSLRVALAHTVVSLLIVFWLADIANLTDLTIWFCVITAMSCFRLVLYSAYKKYRDDQNRNLWLHAWTGSSAILASIYALGLVYFTPFDQSEYTVAVGLFTIALSAGSLMIFSVSAYAVLSFATPLLIIPLYFLLANGGNSGMLTALTMGVYLLGLVLFVNNISAAFEKSIIMSLRHQQERDKRILIEQQLTDINRRDGLTGVYNKRHLDEVLEAEIGRAHRNHQPLCVIMFELDFFHQYQKEYGYVAGDQCLLNVAEIAQNLISRKGDLVARYGGEQFAILLPNIDLKGAVSFANKLQLEVQKRRFAHVASELTTLQCVTISLGVTNLLPFTKAKPHELIKYAQTALYEAKRQGGNRVHFTQNNGLNHSTSF
jgi:diguanylate cyclase (GGDEF)-like protein